jgi:Ca2+/H+ antiporter, TMEM165/GDT1 family
MPGIFGMHAIGFWQALGLLILSKILFGFRGRPGGGMYWRRRMMERWQQMTPEEREKFRAGMQGRCGPFGPEAAQPKA